MNVNDLLKNLALGELSNLALAEGTGTIISDKRPQIILLANEALLRLYTRFVLKEKDVLVEMREGVTNYHLLKKYAYSQYDPENPPTKWCMPYILDLGKEQFQEDVIKVLAVYASIGRKLPLNDLERADSVFTPQSTVVQVPFPIPGQALGIEFQARHPILTVDNLTAEIELPEVLHGALQAYIASKVFMHMNTQENTAKGQEHAINYESICQDVVDRDLVSSSSSTTNSRFHKRGWI